MIEFREIYHCPHRPRRIVMAVRSAMLDLAIDRRYPGWVNGSKANRIPSNRLSRPEFVERGFLFAFLGV